MVFIKKLHLVEKNNTKKRLMKKKKATTEKLDGQNNKCREIKKEKISVFPAGLEPATFRVLGGRDNHYTTETSATE